MENAEHMIEVALGFIVEYGMSLLGAIITLIIGLWIAGMITKNVKKIMVNKNVDPSLVTFLSSLIGALLKVAVFISAANVAGIEMTSFVAILGAAGLAVGLALQGTLQNFAGGVIILLLKPFKVGDFISAGGNSGTVKAIQIFYTILTTPDNKTIVVPNGGLANTDLINFSTQPTRRLDFSFGIGYDDDFEKAKMIIKDLIDADNRIHKDPEPFVRVGELADSSVNITTRVWLDAADYWAVHFDMLEAVKRRFDQEGINIPYPQMNVHVKKV